MNARCHSKVDTNIIRVPLGDLTAYAIAKAERVALERASMESLFCKLAIAALATAVSFLIALLSTTIHSDVTFTVFIVVCGFGFLCGVTFTLLWWQLRGSLKNVAQIIRGRKRGTEIEAPERGETTP